MTRVVDAELLALPLDACADAALGRARELGATHADVRVVSTRTMWLRLRDARVDGSLQDDDSGMSVRVVVDGAWGFAASDAVDAASASTLAERAVAMARVSAALTSTRVELAPEPVHTGTWVSSYDVDPFDVAEHERVGLLAQRSEVLLAHPGVAHATATLHAVKERTFYADLSGTRVTQQRVRLESDLTALAVNPDTGAFETMSTTAPPAGRGWEYVVGRVADVGGARGWDWDAEIAQLGDNLAEKMAAPSVEPGRYDLLIHPTNLWLTIHESIGHATELDRALGYEANYAGTSFATPDRLGSLKYGVPDMRVTGDRVVEHGLSTVGWDDEGVAGQQWDLVKDGILVGYQLDRAMAAENGYERSNGCAYADSATHTAIQRMPNVSLQPVDGGPDLDGLLDALGDGIYIVGDKSWSIDMQRFNFQFTGQRFHKVEGGRIVGQLKDVAYQATTTDFWGSMRAIGGESTYLLGGAFNCGKGQPGQVAAVSHGCPAAVFEQVNILNSAREAARS